MKYIIVIISLTINISCFAQIEIDFDDSNSLVISPLNFPKQMLSYNDNRRITVNIGTVNYGSRKNTYDFTITNMSSEPFIFNRVGWGEPSFAPKWTEEPTIPHRNAKLSYKHVDTKRIGSFYKSSTVKTNLGHFYVSFKGKNLPPDIAIDKSFKESTAYLGDTITASFKIYNKSDTSFLSLSRMSSDFHTFVTCDNQNETSIPPNSYRTFYVKYIPQKLGMSISQIIISLDKFSLEYYIYCNVQKSKKQDKSH